MAKLIDVRPDGYAHNLVEGVVTGALPRLALRIRAPIRLRARPMSTAIDMWATSTSSSEAIGCGWTSPPATFPRYDRNQNTGRELGMDADFRTANQTVFHDRAHPSHLILPVIPR